MADKSEVQWWAFLIGKIREKDLSSENKLRLDQRRAVRSAQSIVGDIPLKPWHVISKLFGGEDE